MLWPKPAYSHADSPTSFAQSSYSATSQRNCNICMNCKFALIYVIYIAPSFHPTDSCSQPNRSNVMFVLVCHDSMHITIIWAGFSFWSQEFNFLLCAHAALSHTRTHIRTQSCAYAFVRARIGYSQLYQCTNMSVFVCTRVCVSYVHAYVCVCVWFACVC